MPGVVLLFKAFFAATTYLFGVPMAAALYGSDNARTTAILIAVAIPLFNLLSAVALSVFSEQKRNIFLSLKEIMHNPLIQGSVAAFFFVLRGIKMPITLEILFPM